MADSVRNILRSLSATKPRTLEWKPIFILYLKRTLILTTYGKGINMGLIKIYWGLIMIYWGLIMTTLLVFKIMQQLQFHWAGHGDGRRRRRRGGRRVRRPAARSQQDGAEEGGHGLVIVFGPGWHFNKKQFGLSCGLKNGLRFHFDSVTCPVSPAAYFNTLYAI